MTPGNSNSDKPKTYPMKRPDGTTVRVTVPDDPKPEEMLIDAIRDNLSPQAVAAIVACLQPVNTNDPAVTREVQWFASQLVVAVGSEQINQLLDEIGV
jgi:hypothetical protein